MRALAVLILILAMPSTAIAAHQAYRGPPMARAAAPRPAFRPSPRLTPRPPQPFRHNLGRSFVDRPPTRFPRGPAAMQRQRFVAPIAPTRAIARRVRLHGGVLNLPAVVVLGVPVLLDVPGLGPVSVDERSYQAIYDQLASDNAEAQERVWAELQRMRDSAPPVDGQHLMTEPVRAAGPTNMLPPGFGVAHSSADDSAVVDLAEPISFSDPPPATKQRPTR